jgi:hypothetical protein
MALAWITQVKNDSATTLTLFQNDPSKHPVCNGRQYQQDEPIRVTPGATMDFSWFVIPWRDSGRLLVRGAGGDVTWQVGPFEDSSTDILQGRSAGGVVQNIRLGDTGGPFTADQLEFRLHATKGGVAFESTGSTGRILSLAWGPKLVGKVLSFVG